MVKLSGQKGIQLLEAAGVGTSLGGISATGEFIATLVLAFLGFLPVANRWANQWFAGDRDE